MYTGSSHPALTGDMDLLNRIVELAWDNGGLDAGCGAGARDVHLLQAWGYDIYGIDAVEENISLGRELHAEIADKPSVADLRDLLSFESGFFDFVLCNAVIQHLSPEATETTAIPELARVSAPGGILQMMFKTGSGVATVSDGADGVDGVARCFNFTTSTVCWASWRTAVLSGEPRREQGLGLCQGRWEGALKEPNRGLAASITTTLRRKGTLINSSWRPAHALDSFVALPSAKRFSAKN